MRVEFIFSESLEEVVRMVGKRNRKSHDPDILLSEGDIRCVFVAQTVKSIPRLTCPSPSPFPNFHNSRLENSRGEQNLSSKPSVSLQCQVYIPKYEWPVCQTR
jgi:hypothetical protein